MTSNRPVVPRRHTLRQAMGTPDLSIRATLLAQACPDIDQDHGMAELARAVEAFRHHARDPYLGPRILADLIELQRNQEA